MIRGVEQKKFATEACAGIELVFSSDVDRWGRERICVVEDRLYVLTVVGVRRHVFGSYGDHFFESFETTPSPVE